VAKESKILMALETGQISKHPGKSLNKDDEGNFSVPKLSLYAKKLIVLID
jgi:hypothetical protein